MKIIGMPIAFLALLLVTSCAHRSLGPQLIWTASTAYATGKLPPKLEIFRQDEEPAVCIAGFDGRKIKIDVVNLSSGDVAWEMKPFTPSARFRDKRPDDRSWPITSFDQPSIGLWHMWRISTTPPHTMPLGSYQARVSVGGLVVATSNFKITPPQLPMLRYEANTEPPGAWVYEEGHKLSSWWYMRRLTDAEIQAGKAELPTLVIDMPGYTKIVLPAQTVTLDNESLKSLRSDGSFHNAQKLYLQHDPDYPLAEDNMINLTVNSEPQGARIYSDGKLMGTTPLTVNYHIKSANYKSGTLRSTPLIAASDGCLPSRQDLELQVDPSWGYEHGQTHEYATLFLLERDPNYHPPPILVQPNQAPPIVVQSPQPNQQQTVIIRQQKDALDLLQQVGQIGIVIKSLKPIR